LSGLALVGPTAGSPQLLAIGDKKSRLARAILTDEPLEWTDVDLGRDRRGRDGGQLEGIAVAGDDTILVICEDPPLVLVLDAAGDRVARIKLVAGDHRRLDDIFDESSSSGEGLVPLRDDRLLIAKEKDPPLLVEFGRRSAVASAIAADSFHAAGERLGAMSERLHALAAWTLPDVDDISDLAIAGGVLYCLSDQSRRVVAVDLPLHPDSGRAQVVDSWELRVPERHGEPDGKPEGLVVTDDGAFIVGLDTETPRANLCWYQP
jgi:uncharacterized protein YjiK